MARPRAAILIRPTLSDPGLGTMERRELIAASDSRQWIVGSGRAASGLRVNDLPVEPPSMPVEERERERDRERGGEPPPYVGKQAGRKYML